MRWLVLIGVLAWSAGARADTYEWQRVTRVLQQLGLTPADGPLEGKRIEWIRIASDDVFVADEVWPLWLNWFHWTTRERIVRRELLFQEGASFENARIEETMRNLRGMNLFALVRIVAVKVDDPNAVGIVVHTRDLWSLRLETGFNASTIVDQFNARLIERNFLGLNQQLGVNFNLLPRTYLLSEEYTERRVLGSTVRVEQVAGVVFNRERQRAEGSTWLLRVAEPFYYLKQKYAWSASGTYTTQVVRQLERKRIQTFPSTTEDPDGPYAQSVWRQQNATATAAGYRRVGEQVKNTFGLGWDFRYRHSQATRETMLVPELNDYFETRLIPRERQESGPIVSYDMFTPTFVTFENLATFGQSENVRVGPAFTLSSRVPLRAFGSNTSSWVVDGVAGYTYAPAGFLLDAKLEVIGRLERDRLVDQRVIAQLRGASPILFKAFRVVARANWDARRDDTLNTFVTLGSSNGLRGYTSQELRGRGASRLLANFELRSVPFLAWEAIHAGAVLFWDMGTVYNKRNEVSLVHAVGLGLRVLLPQLNRTPFSFDGGAALNDPPPDDIPFRLVPTIKDGQVVPVTAVEDEVE
ncbi:MAG TPA: BamA/TamA family outer membrane protein [Polyangiales bacterium]|nr:BamA/TamA family outer membrane protein [Polyangiales bacterium]